VAPPGSFARCPPRRRAERPGGRVGSGPSRRGSGSARRELDLHRGSRVDKDGKEWYQVTLGGSDGSLLSGESQPGKVVGPSFSAAEVPDVIEAVLETYRRERQHAGDKFETFIQTLRRVGNEPFKAAANAARHPAQDAETV